MLTSRYMTSIKNLDAILDKVIEGTAPDRFTIAHLKSIGFKSSNDQGIIPLFKDLGFLTPDGAPTPRYHKFRDTSQAGKILGEALHEAYEDLFHVNEKPTEANRKELEGKFKATHNVKDGVAKKQAMTFLALLKKAELPTAAEAEKSAEVKIQPRVSEPSKEAAVPKNKMGYGSECQFSGLRYNIEIHLPATKDVEVYNSIFKSLKEHLLDS